MTKKEITKQEHYRKYYKTFETRIKFDGTCYLWEYDEMRTTYALGRKE